LFKITDIIFQEKGSTSSTIVEAISAFEEYCNIWKLTVNTNKIKIVVFRKKKYETNVVFKIYGQAVDHDSWCTAS
jgi:ATP phosphoribosyltransferase regulatory subunit HisZ